MHPDYRPDDFNHRKSDADIGILIMENPVKFSNFIQPICLPSSSQNLKYALGTVAGYGITELYNTSSAVPRHIKLRIDDLLECYASDPLSSQVLSLRSFCAENPAGVLCDGELNLKYFLYSKDSFKVTHFRRQWLSFKLQRQKF